MNRYKCQHNHIWQGEIPACPRCAMEAGVSTIDVLPQVEQRLLEAPQDGN